MTLVELLVVSYFCVGEKRHEILREGASSYCLVSCSEGEQIQDGCFTILSITSFQSWNLFCEQPVDRYSTFSTYNIHSWLHCNKVTRLAAVIGKPWGFNGLT